MRIGLIDFNLNNAHANRYVQLLPEEGGADVEISSVWAVEEHLSREWARQHKVSWGASAEEVARHSDAVMLLAPDNPEMHYPFAEKVFPHVGLVFIDKTFARSVKEGEAIYALADSCGTKAFSTSALRYAPALVQYQQTGAVANAVDVEIKGPGKWNGYGVHTVEPAITLFGADIKRLRTGGSEDICRVEVEWSDGRTGLLTVNGVAPSGYDMRVSEKGNSVYLDLNDRAFYAGLCRTALQFFRTGVPPVVQSETLTILRVLEAANQSRETGNWVTLS